MSEYPFLPDWPPSVGPLTWFALLLVAAVVLGELAARRLRLPRIVGYVCAGMALGPHGSGLLDQAMLDELGGLVVVALGLLLFELGHRLSFGWLRRNPWLLAASLLEAGLAFAAMFAVLVALGIDAMAASAAAAIGMSTSPAVVVRLTGELRTQGQVSERLLMLSALNSVYAVLAVTMWLAWLHLEYRSGPLGLLLHPVYLVCGSFLLAAIGAVVLGWLHDAFGRNEETDFLILAGAILLVVTLALAARLSVLLALLALGALVKNHDQRLRVIPKHFSVASAAFVVMLFTLTGASLDPRLLAAGGLAALAYVLARMAGKIGGIAATARLSGIGAHKGLMLGLALAPMSGLAVVLVQNTAAIYPALGEGALEVVLAAVVVMELAGPVIAAAALGRAREARPS